MSDINQQIYFFALVWRWAVSLSKNELDTIFSNTVGANIKDSTTTIHIERARAFFCRKTDDKFLKWEFLVCISSAKGLGHWWGQILSESLAANTNMLSLSQEETPAARATHYLSRVWEGCDRCDGEDGFAPQTNRYCSWVHQGIGPSTGFAFLSQNDLDHFHLEHIFHKSNQDQYPPSICKSSNCIK